MLPEGMDKSLGFNIYRTELLFRKELLRALSCYKITPEQWQVLNILWHAEKPVIQNNISKILFKDKHTVSRIIKRLERDGWIVKQASPDDARAIIISLTAKGKSLQKKAPDLLFGHFRDILKDFDRDEINRTVKLLRSIREKLGDRLLSESNN